VVLYGMTETDAKELITSIETGWNSDFQDMKRALVLRDCVDKFVEQNCHTDGSAPGLGRDSLYPDDWTEIRQLTEILEPFERYTLALEGKCPNGALCDVFPVYDRLMKHLEDSKVRVMVWATGLAKEFRVRWSWPQGRRRHSRGGYKSGTCFLPAYPLH
jgi:hypothetical protein